MSEANCLQTIGNKLSISPAANPVTTVPGSDPLFFDFNRIYGQSHRKL
jgi:hypothetical protein